MALVILMLLTLLGLTAMNTTALEEKMSNNVKDKNIALQAAEAALVLAENWIAANTTHVLITGAPDNTKGIYAAQATPLVLDAFWAAAGGYVVYPNLPTGPTGGQQFTNVVTQPKYIIEQLQVFGTAPNQKRGLRITARGTGSTDAAVVILQSTVEIPAS